MSIEQEKMIVEALPSLYPLKDYEEDAIHTVLEALPHWIPVPERLPEENGLYQVTDMQGNVVRYVFGKGSEEYWRRCAKSMDATARALQGGNGMSEGTVNAIMGFAAGVLFTVVLSCIVGLI